MAAPTITAAAVSESGHDVSITFSAAMNQTVVVSGLSVKLGGVAVALVRTLWASPTVLMVRLIRCATKTETATIALSSCNLSDVATSTNIANAASVAVTNGSLARFVRSRNGARTRY